MVFLKVLFCVATMLIFMACGFAASKAKIANPDHSKTISGFLVYICNPCLIFTSVMKSGLTLDKLKDAGLFFLFTLLAMLVFFFILYLAFRKRFSDPLYRLFTCGAILGNVGFFGLPIASQLFPDDPSVYIYGVAYMGTMNILMFTLGIYLITNNKKYITAKAAMLNPAMIAIVVSVVIFTIGVPIPDLISDAAGAMADMTTPLCMFILGLRLSKTNFRDIFLKPFPYVASIAKLIVFPMFVYLAVYFLPFANHTFRATAFILSASPCATFTLSFAEIHGVEQEKCAALVILSTLLGLITLPLISLMI